MRSGWIISGLYIPNQNKMKILIDSAATLREPVREQLYHLAGAWNKPIEEGVGIPEDLNLLEEADLALIFIVLPTTKKTIRKYLNHARGLRMPYVFITENMQWQEVKNVLLPIGFLEEEVGKAQYAAAFGRFCQSHITVLQPNDYGSRAQKNINKSKELFDKFSLPYQIVKGKKDSFKLEQEAAKRTTELKADLLIMSSSRDYGLDDILFGPKEQHVIMQSQIPVMFVNPRKDLYSLCD